MLLNIINDIKQMIWIKNEKIKLIYSNYSLIAEIINKNDFCYFILFRVLRVDGS